MSRGLVKIKTAIVSVSNKKGIEALLLELRRWNIQVIATGGTYRTITEKGFSVLEVSDITRFPEILDGRVKTLHPLIHGGILASRIDENHSQELRKYNIGSIDLVVCDLYPFSDVVDSGRKKEV